MNLNPQGPSSRRSSANAFLLVVLGWLLPGSGFLFLGRRYRGRAILFCAVVHVTFLLGVCMHGGVGWPVWGLRDLGFSVVNNLNFIFQMGAGWLGLVSLAAHRLGWSALAVAEPHAFSDLGSFYCLVAGALNYFIICQSVERRNKVAFEILAKQ